MSDVDGTCEYVLDPNNPETWGGEEGDECHAYKDAINDDRVWACPHDTVEGEDLCIFHLPIDEKDDQDVVDSFIEKVNQATTENGLVTQPRKLEFLGAIFGSFNLSDRVKELTLNEGVIKATHIRVSGTLDWSDIVVRGSVRLNASVFTGGISFENAEIKGDTELKWAEIGGDGNLQQAKFEGSVSFYETVFEGTANFKKARFKYESGFFRTIFRGKGDFGKAIFDYEVNLRDSEFSDESNFYETEFRSDARFGDVEFGGEADFFKAVFTEESDFHSAEFRDTANFKSVKFGEDVNFNDVVFDRYSDFSGANFGGETDFKHAKFGPDDTNGRADFQRAEFKKSVEFRSAEFTNEPTFFDAEFKTDVNFIDTTFQDGAWFRDTIVGGTANFSRFTSENEVDFTGAELSGGSFESCDLSDCNFANSTLKTVDLSDVSGENTIFQEANLESADFEGADLSGANLERAKLTNADLFGTDLSGAQLYGARMGDVGINTETVFDERGDSRCVYDPNSEYEYVSDDAEEVNQLRKAMGAYQVLEKLTGENALPDKQANFFARRQDMLRKQRREDGEWGRWIRSWASNIVVRYGESPWRVVGTTAIIIALCGLLYPLYGIQTGGQVVTYDSTSNVLWTLADSFYFSIVTFTTLGYGDVQPVGMARLVAILETIAGSALLALLVFVFGRRATR